MFITNSEDDTELLVKVKVDNHRILSGVNAVEACYEPLSPF
jgi:hypothetical protein